MSLALLELWSVLAGSVHGDDRCCRILGHPSLDGVALKTLRAKLKDSSLPSSHRTALNQLVDNMT